MKINMKIILSVVFIGLISAWLFFDFGSEEEAWKDSIVSVQLIFNEGKYNIDTDKSILRWKGSKKVINDSHEGTLKIKEGTVEINREGYISGEITIDMNSLNCTDLSGDSKANLEAHLSNDDFFSIDKFSESKIVFKSSNANNTKMEFEGDESTLTIKGIPKPISFFAEIKKRNDNELFAFSKLEFDRTNYGIKYNSENFVKDIIANRIIKDEIEIEIELVASPLKD